MKIKKLNPELIKQIAAGEIVARIGNAIKELIENAVDAESKKISIFLKNAGIDEIIIIDDGNGIDNEDLPIACLLHTTSKTNDDDKIFGTRSFGFRGEALSSIDSISDLTLESKGLSYHKGNIAKSNIHIGTKITISKIFEETPARKKFIKNSEIEFAYIKEIFQKYAINFSEIEFNLFHNDKKIYNLLPSNKNLRIQEIFKTESMFFEKKHNNLEISGFLLQKKSKIQMIFVNNRPIRDKAIFAYIKSIMKEYHLIDEAPGYVLFIKIDPFLIDCNVHPAKEEIKFINYKEIFSILSDIFSMQFFKQIEQKDHLIINEIEPLIMDFYKNTNQNFKKEIERKIFSKQPATQEFILNESNDFEIGSKILTKENLKIEFDSDQNTTFKIIGQFLNSFILFETELGLGIFDQHAAHERIIYEQMKKNLSNEQMQKLIMPIELNLTPVQKDYIQKNSEIFKKKGIIFENYKITHIPITLREIDFKQFFEQNEDEYDCEISINRLVADIACKNALKANYSLSNEQMKSLLETALKNPPICNHGRPVFKYFTNNEVRNWFKR